ncbi:S-4TM family putative pore-forming effector [Clostridium baratii]
MNNINKCQNEEKILKYLFSQRYLYEICKKISKCMLGISTIIWISGIIPYSADWFNNSKLLLSFIGTVGIIITEIKGDKVRELAVDFQDYIDRTLFEMKKDKNIIPNLCKLDNKANDIVIENRNEYEKSIKPDYEFSIYNWYSDVSKLPLDIARVVCQNENIRWENRQRKLYSNILIISIIAMVLITLIKINIFNESFFNVLTLAPIVGELIKIVIKNNTVIKAIAEVEDIISSLYINIEERGSRYNKKNITQKSLEIQIKIRKYRLNNISIPEFIYKKMKVKEQKKSSDFIEMKVDEILNNI